MAPTTTPTEKVATELFDKLRSFLDDDLPGLNDRLKTLESRGELPEGVDVNGLVDGLAEVKEKQEKLATAIRMRKNGFYIPGMEDEEFSLTKTIRALIGGGLTRSAFTRAKADHEFDLLKACQEKHRDAFGHIDDEFHVKAQQIGDDELGGAFVPDQLIADVIAPIHTRSAFIALDGNGQTRVTLLDGLSGGKVTMPKFDGGTASTWIGESDEGTETDASTGTRSMVPHKCGTFVNLTEDMLRMGSYGFEGLLRNDLAASVAKLVDRTIAYGSGGEHQPRGILYTDGVKIFLAETSTIYADKATANAAITDSDGGELDFRKMSKMKLGLRRDDVDMDGSFAWISSPDFFDRLRNAQVSMFSGQTTEKAFLLGSPFITEEQLRAAIGDWGDTTQIPYTNKPGASAGFTTDSTNEKYTDVFGGNMSTILVGRWGGLEITTDNGLGTGFTKDITKMKVRQRLSMMVRQPKELIVCVDALAQDL